ncbi:uncharacterized protein ARMOST_20294 [Armillaria ostoyae]|uniref:Uncharacterized protein n=1 Tax=Armillaria ostoyae TaxID=47428 RepID=A0A284S6Y6_ARMOS|nr:uncharacterized protein ARMOST_20294 [Armillaria ostoyae]
MDPSTTLGPTHLSLIPLCHPRLTERVVGYNFGIFISNAFQYRAQLVPENAVTIPGPIYFSWPSRSHHGPPCDTLHSVITAQRHRLSCSPPAVRTPAHWDTSNFQPDKSDIFFLAHDGRTLKRRLLLTVYQAQMWRRCWRRCPSIVLVSSLRDEQVSDSMMPEQNGLLDLWTYVRPGIVPGPFKCKQVLEATAVTREEGLQDGEHI